jgi:hypothetical protein
MFCRIPLKRFVAPNLNCRMAIIGTFFPYKFERRTAAIAVYLSVNAMNKNLISSKK